MAILRSSPPKALLIAVSAAALLTLSACEVGRGAPPAQVLSYGVNQDSLNGIGIVQQGDTVWKIAERYRLPVRDIIDLNNLQPPYRMAAGTRLKLPAPVEHRVGNNDTLNSVSRMYNVPASQLVRINRLSAPYHLMVGQVIRMPSQASSGNMLAMAEDTPPQPGRKPAIAAEPPSHKTTAIAKQPALEIYEAPPGQAEVETTVASSARPDFVWPIQGKVISSYGPKDGQLYNDGINIAAPRGTPVVSAADGIVAYVGDDLASFGNLVLIRHSGGMITAYAHMASVTVRKGAAVRRGQAIGSVGSTGRVASTQLHFEIRKGTETLDPQKYL